MHVLKLHNIEVATSEPLTMRRAGALVGAVQTARGKIALARHKTFEALACTSRPGVQPGDLPPRYLGHFRTLFRCTGDDAALLRTMRRVANLLQVLDIGFNSPALRFREYGTDLVSTVLDKAARLFGAPGLYQPSDVAMVRGFSVARGSAYVGPAHVEGCLNTGKSTGNPNEIQIRLTSLDNVDDNFIDTVIHEATHKFLGTVDDGMNSSTFGWMEDDGLASYQEQNPGVPLPIDRPGFLSKTPEQAAANAYLLTAYILYLPEGDITARTELNRQARAGHLGRDTELGRLMREGAARMQPRG